MTKPKRDEQPSTFWPIILIGVGIIWLLNNLGILTGANIAAVFRLWPLFLIFIGLDMLIGRERQHLRPLLGLAAVAVLVIAAFIGPSLGLSDEQTVESWVQTVPLGSSVEQAAIRIDASSAPLQIDALANPSLLADIQIVDTGQINLNTTDGSTATLDLSKQSPVNFGWFTGPENRSRRWDIDLSDRVPFDLELDLASGNSRLNLATLQLDSLTIDAGSGNVDLHLPGGSYNIVTEHGSGHWRVTLRNNAAFEWTVRDLDSGSLTVTVPEHIGVRLDVRDDGSGAIDVPSGWQQLSGDDEEGVWESGDYSNADYRVTIIIEERGSGAVVVRQ